MFCLFRFFFSRKNSDGVKNRTRTLIRSRKTVPKLYRTETLTDASHNPLVGDGGNQVRVRLGAGEALGLQHVVGILQGGRGGG